MPKQFSGEVARSADRQRRIEEIAAEADRLGTRLRNEKSIVEIQKIEALLRELEAEQKRLQSELDKAIFGE